MLSLKVKYPTDLWLSLGDIFFTVPHKNFIDRNLGNTRFISVNNVFEVEEWSREWTGDAIYEMVGYSSKGPKMKILRESYVDEKKLQELKRFAHGIGRTPFKAIGMNFKMAIEKKGGCLSSLHLIRIDDSWQVIVQGKIAEIPRKFSADLRLVAELIRELGLTTEAVRVRFMFSAVFFSIITLRAYVPVLGVSKKDFRSIPIMTPRKFQVGVQDSIRLSHKNFEKRFGKSIWKLGMINQIDRKRGDWSGYKKSV